MFDLEANVWKGWAGQDGAQLMSVRRTGGSGS